MKEGVILEARPAKRSFLLGYMLFPLIFPLVVVWFKRRGTRLIVFEDRVVLRRGVLSKHVQEILIRDIRTVRVSQSPLQRMLGIGKIEIATSGTAGVECAVSGLARPGTIEQRIMGLVRGRERH